jgi:hypothetical protein
MKAGWIIPVLMGTFVLSSPGMAASVSTSHSATLSNHGETESRIEMMSRCTSLEGQLAEAIEQNSKASDQVADAEALRSQGASLCDKPQDGIVKLKSALRELGVTPRS